MENFKKLTGSEKNHLIDEVRDRNLMVYFKFDKSPVFKSKIASQKKNIFLSAKKPTQLHSSFHMQIATVIIALEQERYFFTSPIVIEDNTVFIRSDMDVYHFLRRKQRRVLIPENYPAYFMVKRIDSNLSFLRAIIRDISDGGMRLSLNSEMPKVKIDQSFVGTIRLATRRGMEVRGTVRHHKKEKSGSYRQTFGLEFSDLSDHAKSVIANQLLDVQRDLFSLFIKKESGD